jgi:CheY-like chemotaxis protein
MEASDQTNVTERKQDESALRDADRRKDRFLALLAHELRNPLASLRSGLQVMRLAGSDQEICAKVHGMMERQLGHIVRIIDDLLDISRINENKIELRRSRVLLTDVISSAVETARPAIEAAGHQLSISLPAEPVYLDADLTRLSQVFSNLLTNSAKYTDGGGQIWLTAASLPGEVAVSIRDTGIGIPADALPRIFDMFSQVDRNVERTAGGLGIGLALVKSLVELHDGVVTAVSDGPGQGSTFTVRFPVLTAADVVRHSAPADATQPLPSPRHRILVVDDNHDAANSMAMLLKMLGHDVRVAHDGLEAVEIAESFAPRAILMDIGMPKLSGYDATQRLRQQPWGRNVIIIALTGLGQDLDRAHSGQAGCNGHLVKPVQLSDLKQLLANLDLPQPLSPE